jgi:hypothetical protein
MIKYTLSRSSHIRIAKFCIGITIWEIVIFGAFLGYVVPYLGGHGSSSFLKSVPLIAIPLMLIGSIIGFLFSRISSIARNHFESSKALATLYIYVWCVLMMCIGKFGVSIASDSNVTNFGMYLLLMSPGIIGAYALIVKMVISSTDNSEANNEENV